MGGLSKLALAAALALATTVSAEAACSTRQIGGTWLMLSSAGVLCSVLGTQAGKIQKSNCYNLADISRAAGKLTGTFRVDAKCTVTGTLTEVAGGRRQNFTFEGKLKGGKTIEGVSRYPSGVVAVLAYKQW